jgi:hypothetical protein
MDQKAGSEPSAGSSRKDLRGFAGSQIEGKVCTARAEKSETKAEDHSRTPTHVIAPSVRGDRRPRAGHKARRGPCNIRTTQGSGVAVGDAASR